MFGTNNFIGSKPEVKKQFVHVAAHNIVNELVNMEEGLDCECQQVSPYSGYNVCKESYAKEVSLFVLLRTIIVFGLTMSKYGNLSAV